MTCKHAVMLNLTCSYRTINYSKAFFLTSQVGRNVCYAFLAVERQVLSQNYSYEGQMAIFIKIINVFTMEHAVSFLGIDTHLCKMECLQDYSLQHLDSS